VDLGSALIDDLCHCAKVYAPRRRKNNDSFHGRSADVTETFLYQIAKCFRKKALRAWEKKHDKDKSGVLSGFKQSHETVASLYSESDQDHDRTPSQFLKITEAGAFRVPLPVVSAGELIFFISLHLILFYLSS
jgi:hypothetical protein